MAATRKLVQTTSIPELPPPPDFKFSSIIDGMNDILGAVGGSVEIKRKKANGVVEEMTDQEGAVKVADYRLKANATQHSMQHLTYTQKKAWVEARKSEGNSFFKAGKYDGAIQKYMEAVMGISSGDTAEEKEDSILSLQIPLLTNIAISMIAKEEWGRARSLLDEAIQHLNDVSPSSIKDRGFTMLAIKAYSRRGMCFVQIGLLKDASHDFRSALHLCQEQYPENKTLLHSIKRKLNDTKHRIEKDKKFVHQMMNGMTYKGDSLNHNSKAVLHLYEDRYDDAQKRTAPRNTRDGQFIDKVQVHNKSLSQSAELGEDNVYDSEDGESIGDLSLLTHLEMNKIVSREWSKGGSIDFPITLNKHLIMMLDKVKEEITTLTSSEFIFNLISTPEEYSKIQEMVTQQLEKNSPKQGSTSPAKGEPKSEKKNGKKYITGAVAGALDTAVLASVVSER